MCGQCAGRSGDVGIKQPVVSGPVRTNMVYHAAGWLEGGLIASPEKFIMDCEVQMIQRYFEPATYATTPDDIAIDAIKDVGATGHFFGVENTQERMRRRSTNPSSATGPISRLGPRRRNMDCERAHKKFKEILATFEEPQWMSPFAKNWLIS